VILYQQLGTVIVAATSVAAQKVFVTITHFHVLI
jgi:hypothetical protein